ncbi:MAG TPA: ATP-binding protein [Opitutaceae bacterium]|nr:ATP-binding protein [Opitutaceae bacterium]
MTNAKTGMNEAQIAVLVLDGSGRVTAANQEAKTLWQTGAGELVGEFFPGLFELDIVSDEPRMLEAQWEVLLAATLEKSAVLSVQPREGAPRPMIVRAERSIGAAGGYIVVIEPPLEPGAAPSAFPDDQAEALQLFAEKGDVGFFDLNLKARRVVYSPAWKRMLGYADSELADTYEAWLNLLHPEDSAAAPDKAGRKFKVGARPFGVEFRMKHKLGHWAWIQCVGLQMVSPWGDLERVIGIHIDASERKDLEESALASDARLRSLSDEGSLAAFELDFTARTSWFSDAWLRMLGGTPAPEDGPATLAGAFPPEEFPGGIEAWLLHQEPGQSSFSKPVRLRGKDGRAIPALLSLNRTLTRKRTLARVVGFVCPIPEGDSADAAPAPAAPAPAETPPKAPAQGLFDEVLATLSEGVIATDANGHVLFGNATASRLLRIPVDGFAGRPLDQVFSLVDRQSGRAGDNAADRALSSSGPLPLVSDQAVTVVGGEPVPVVWTARASYGPDSGLLGVVIVFRNPDEMGLTPEELIKANRHESVALLAAGIANDFNNLLTTILGGLSLAKENRDPSGLAESEEACLAAKNLTKQLLTFAKGGTGALTVCDSKEILEEAVKIASAGSAVEITVQAPAGTGAVKVDRAQILQVFQNLILNSLQAMPPAPHNARLQLRAADVHIVEGQIASLQPGDYVEFEVRDNGSGISPEHLERIWDPFFTTKKHGTGLGLSTAMAIVRKCGGEIGLQSTVGVGTVFSVFLPIADQPVDVQARPAPSQRFNTGRVLFMDDDDHICALTASMLQSLDYKFDIAKNGDDAITFYKRYLNIGRPYDAVIMDLTVVGGLGGEEAFRILRELDPEVRAIVSTGYDNEDMARQYLDMGFCGYLTKPYRVADLGKVLKAVLG